MDVSEFFEGVFCSLQLVEIDFVFAIFFLGIGLQFFSLTFFFLLVLSQLRLLLSELGQLDFGIGFVVFGSADAVVGIGDFCVCFADLCVHLLFFGFQVLVL